MFHPSVGLVVLFSLHNSALATQNGSALIPRTLSGYSVMDAAEPIEYGDPSVLAGLKDRAGSGSGSEQRPVRSRRPQERYLVSDEAAAFLRGRLSTGLVPTVYALVFAISVPLNLVAVVMFARHARPRKPAVIYMLNMACADLLFGLLLPFKIAYHYRGNDWIYGPFLCRVVTAAFYCNMYCSVLLITCIGADRFLAVVYPMEALAWRTPRAASAACASMWLLALAGACPLLASGQTSHLSELGITTCHDVQPADKLRAYYAYFFLAYSCVFFFVPLAFTVFFYVGVIGALASAGAQSRSRKTRAAVTAVLVLAVFVLCFTPANVILAVHYAVLLRQPGDSSYQAYLLSTCVGSVSCCLDPALYYFGSSRCRKQVAALLGRRRLTRAESGSAATQSSRTSGWTDSGRSLRVEGAQSGLEGHYCRLVA